MEQSKVRSYLLYATGEILLVVIGILIALQVNNWNEERSLKRSAEKHVQILITNLNEDLEKLTDITNSLELTQLSANSMMDRFMLLRPADPDIYYDIIQVIFEYNFQPNKNGIEVLINTGEFGVLADSVQHMINQYYNIVERVQERDAISNTFIKNEYEAYIFDKLNYIWSKGSTHPTMEIYKKDKREELPPRYNEILNDKKLEGLIFARKYQTEIQLTIYNQGIEEVNQLLSVLQGETE